MLSLRDVRALLQSLSDFFTLKICRTLGRGGELNFILAFRQFFVRRFARLSDTTRNSFTWKMILWKLQYAHWATIEIQQATDYWNVYGLIFFSKLYYIRAIIFTRCRRSSARIIGFELRKLTTFPSNCTRWLRIKSKHIVVCRTSRRTAFVRARHLLRCLPEPECGKERKADIILSEKKSADIRGNSTLVFARQKNTLSRRVGGIFRRRKACASVCGERKISRAICSSFVTRQAQSDQKTGGKSIEKHEKKAVLCLFAMLLTLFPPPLLISSRDFCDRRRGIAENNGRRKTSSGKSSFFYCQFHFSPPLPLSR